MEMAPCVHLWRTDLKGHTESRNAKSHSYSPTTNRDNANTIATILKMTGSEARAVYDGETAVEVADDWKPDTVLLDIKMPRS